MSEMNIAPAAAQNENKLSAFGEAIQMENARIEASPATDAAEDDVIQIAFDAIDAKNFVIALLEGIEGVGERSARGEISHPANVIHFLCDAAKQVLLQL